MGFVFTLVIPFLFDGNSSEWFMNIKDHILNCIELIPPAPFSLKEKGVTGKTTSYQFM